MNIGITERGDAGLDLSWESKLLPANILITKSVNDKFIEAVLRNHHKIIIHITCTGFGGTRIEPNVKSAEWTHSQVLKLIRSGFPVSHLVLRTDPIIPTQKGIQTVESVWKLFKDTGIKRVRYSFIDMYPHVRERFIENNISIPFDSFCAPKSMIEKALETMKPYEYTYEFEACAEYTPHRLGCISQKDFEILRTEYDTEPAGFQRKGCLCVAGKHELLSNKYRCPHKCAYCYWKDKESK